MRFDPTPARRETSFLEILGQQVRIGHNSPATPPLISDNFGAMAVQPCSAPPNLDYLVELDGDDFAVTRQGQPPRSGTGLGDLLYSIEKDLTVELQRKRDDLFFLHAAAVEWRGKAYLLAAEAGSGKSTTTWALLHHGFGYLSDELSPIDLRTMQVYPYPHALCMKQLPPAYPLPPEALHLGRTVHVPASALPGPVIVGPRPLGGVFFVAYSPESSAPTMTRISAAEGAARMYVNALNALAHVDAGLAPVLRMAGQVPCYALSSAGLPETCALIRATLEAQ